MFFSNHKKTRTLLVCDLLPIGSVVRLKDGEKKLMITGILQTDTDTTHDPVHYDYIGVLYPEGHIGPGFQYLFHHEDMEEILFRGYEDAERTRFLETLCGL